MTFQKKILKTVFTSTVVASLFAVQAFGAATGQVTGDNVNIRSSASSNSEVVGKGHKGSELIILDKQDDWFRVSFNGDDDVYVAEDFLKVSRAEGTVNASGVNVRSGPSKESAILKTLNEGDVITVIGQNSNWYQLAYNNGQTYVSKEFLTGSMLEYLPQIAEEPVFSASVAVQNTYGIVTANGGLNIREGASTDTKIVGTLANDEVFDVTETTANWLKIKSESGIVGYVSAEFVALRTGEKPSRSISSNKGEQVVSYAKQFLGTPYVYGGTNLNSGVDCSGFVYSVMQHYGVRLNRRSTDMAANGVPVDKNQLVAGDLVFFNTDGTGRISHVGIYVGGGEYIHSSSGKTRGVIISNLNDDYSLRTYATARRVLR